MRKRKRERERGRGVINRLLNEKLVGSLCFAVAFDFLPKKAF